MRDPVSGNTLTDPRKIAHSFMLSMVPFGDGKFSKYEIHDCDERKRKTETEALKTGIPGLIPSVSPKIAFGLAVFVGIKEAP